MLYLQHLSSPPTLTRIPLLRARIQKERASLQSSLSARAKEQVNLVTDGLQGLREVSPAASAREGELTSRVSSQARNAIEGVKEGMRDVEETMSNPVGQIEGFPKIIEVRRSSRTHAAGANLPPQVSLIHRRFVQAVDMVTSLRGMYSRLSHISDLLASDRSDPLGPCPNLLPIHYHLSELETFRNETLAQAKKGQASSGSKATLEQYFERLGETIEAFEAHYFRLAQELLELARKGNGSVAVKIAKIAEVEGTRDEKAVTIRMLKKSGNVDVAARFRNLQADARTLKHYRSKVMDAIRESCKSAIERSFKRNGEDGIAWLEDLDWIYEDLTLVETELVPSFPKDWKVSRVWSHLGPLIDPSALRSTTCTSRRITRRSTTSSTCTSSRDPMQAHSSASLSLRKSTSRR